MCTDTQETMANFLFENPVTMVINETSKNPNMETVNRKQEMYHWHITLEFNGRTLQTYYSTGCGHTTKRLRKGKFLPRGSHEYYQIDDYRKGKNQYNTPSVLIIKYLEPKEPTIEDILDCLVSDSNVLDYSTYESWGPDLGYDEDSRKGEAIYRLCIQQALELRRLFGSKLFDRLQECERL